MRRREFITLLGGAATWPLVARAQQGDRVRRVGVLMNAAATEVEYQGYLAAFVQEMGRLGWSERQNLRLDVRWKRRGCHSLSYLREGADRADAGRDRDPLIGQLGSG